MFLYRWNPSWWWATCSLTSSCAKFIGKSDLSGLLLAFDKKCRAAVLAEARPGGLDGLGFLVFLQGLVVWMGKWGSKPWNLGVFPWCSNTPIWVFGGMLDLAEEIWLKLGPKAEIMKLACFCVFSFARVTIKFENNAFPFTGSLGAIAGKPLEIAPGLLNNCRTLFGWYESTSMLVKLSYYTIHTMCIYPYIIMLVNYTNICPNVCVLSL